MQRVSVLGTSGCGKTTLAAALARRLGVPHVELDALHWEPHWTPAAPEVFRARVAAALAGDGWVCDGNYSPVRDLVLARADTLVWLDYPLGLILWRLLGRTVRRVVTGEELWQGNRERFWEQFFARDSLLWWVLTTHARRGRQLTALFADPAYAHLNRIRLRSPRATTAWLAAIPARSA